MDNRTRLRRLNKLAELLEGITDKKHFKMETWAEHNGSPRAFADDAPHLEADGRFGCGTAACALGYAALHPSFRRSGLKLGAADHWMHGPIWAPEFEGLFGFAAGEAFFGLTGDDARSIFDPSAGAGKTPKQVAKRVRKLIRQYESS